MKILMLIISVLIFASGCSHKIYEKCTVVSIDETKLFGVRVNTEVGYFCEIIDGVKQ